MTTLQKIWVVPVITFIALTLLMLVADGLTGMWVFLFDLGEWHHNILKFILDKWFMKLMVIMFLYSYLMLFVVLIFGKRKY